MWTPLQYMILKSLRSMGQSKRVYSVCWALLLPLTDSGSLLIMLQRKICTLNTCYEIIWQFCESATMDHFVKSAYLPQHCIWGTLATEVPAVQTLRESSWLPTLGISEKAISPLLKSSAICFVTLLICCHPSCCWPCYMTSICLLSLALSSHL